MTRSIPVLALVLFVLGTSCRRREADPDDGGAPPIDAPGAIDAGPPTLDAMEAAALTRTALGLGMATALAAPLVAEGEMLRDEGSRVAGAEREGATRTRVESAFSGSSVVEPATCASYAWSGLTASVTLTGCTLELTGDTIDGTISVGASFHPTRLTATFTTLSIGELTVDGSLSLNLGGRCRALDADCTDCATGDTACEDARAEQRTLTGELTITTGTTTVLAVDSLTVGADATGATASGTVTVGTTTATIADLFWAWGDCLPTSGTATIPASMTTLTFLASTPATGAVEVSVRGYDLGEETLFTPCPP